MAKKLSDYDQNLLSEARKLIMTVYEYYYGDSQFRSHYKRLETIINKIDEVKELETKG